MLLIALFLVATVSADSYIYTPQTYDNIDDSSINESLWSNSTTTGSVTENSDYIRGTVSMTGPGANEVRLNGFAFPNYNLTSNITAYVNLYTTRTGSCFSGSSTFFAFGDTVKSIGMTGSCSGTNSDTSNYVLVRNGSFSQGYNFLVYDDGTYITSVTPNENNISFFSQVQGGTGSANAKFDVYNITYLSVDSLEVDLISPDDTSVLSSASSLFNATFYSVPSNLTNSTLYVWYGNGSLMNTNFTTISGSSNNSELYLTLPDIGNYEWNYYVCSQSQCTFNTQNNSLSYGFTTTNSTFNSSVLETSQQTYSVNVSVPSEVSVQSARLIYNGSTYSDSTVSGSSGNFTISKSIVVPSGVAGFGVENRTFYWNITLNNLQTGLSTTFITSDETQEVTELSLSLCGGTYIVPLVNFTLYDEQTENLIGAGNLTTFEATFFYGVSEDGKIKNYSLINQSVAENEFDFCVQSYSQPIYADADIEYTALGYLERTYYLRDAQLTNVTNLINLYLLSEDVGQKFFFDVRLGVSVFADAIVTISKYFPGEGVYKTIDIRKTDDAGKFIEYLELDKSYRYLVTKDGTAYGIVDKDAICGVTPCEETIQLSDSDTDLFGAYYDLFGQNISYNLSYDQSTKIVSFSYVDLTGLATYARLEVKRLSLNSTGENICNVFVYSSFGSMTCNMTGYSGDFVINTYISRSPEILITYITIFVQDIYEQVGDTGIFVVIILMFLTVGAFWADPQIGIIMLPIDMILLRFIQLLPLSWGAVSAITLVCIVILVMMGRQR